MLKKRLKGLLAMLVAGSVAASSLMTSASATIEGNISIVGGGTVYPSDIICTDGVYSFESPSHDAISGDLGSDKLWAIYADKGGTESGYIITTAKGDELAEKLYGLKDSSTEYENVKIKNSHKVLVTTDDPSVTDTDVSGAANVSEFPYEISFSDFGFTPINNPLQEATWTVWYGAEFGNTVDRYSVEKGASYAIPAGSTEIEIPMSTVENIYKPVSGGSTIPFGIGVTIIQLQNNYKTFEIPVYNGWGEDTNEKISVTNTSTGDFSSIGLKGEYVLVYDGEPYYYSYSNFTTKEALWNVIQSIANEKGEFDVSKAKLVRYVRYDAVIGYFTSVDLLNEGADNRDINYINERKNSGSIWKISCSVMGPAGYQIYPNKFVYGDSFDAEIKEFLNEYDCDTVSLRNKTELHITATDPSTQTNPHGGFKLTDSGDNPQYITIDTDKQYPVKVSDLAAKLTAEISPTAGMKYNKDEWELWPCYTSTGNITMDSKATVSDPTADIGITHYELAQEQHRNDLLVYFKQVAIAPAVNVTAPVVGNAPSTECTTTDNVGGYKVKDGSVSWSVNGTPLTGGAKFEAGKQYTFSVTLIPDTGLEFASTTAVKINGNDATTTLNTDDGTLKVSYTFEALTAPTTPTNPTYPTYPPYPTTPTTPITPTTPTTPDKPEEPKEPEDNGNGPDWGDISKEIEKAKDGDKIDIDMGDTSVLPGDILDSIAGKDITIVLDMGDGLTWTINGMDVTNPGDIDMGVSLGSEGIPVQVINLVTGELSYVTITLNHSGDFGFTAVLTIDMGKENKGFYANLYYYNEEISDAEFMCAGKINSKGKADLTFTHASEYIIVIDRYSHENKDDIDASEEDTTDSEVDAGTDKPSDDNPSTGVGISCTALLFAGMAVIASAKRRKREE